MSDPGCSCAWSWSLCCRTASTAAVLPLQSHLYMNLSTSSLHGQQLGRCASHDHQQASLCPSTGIYHPATRQHVQPQRRSACGDELQPQTNKSRSGAQPMTASKPERELRGLLLAVAQRRDLDDIGGASQWYLHCMSDPSFIGACAIGRPPLLPRMYTNMPTSLPLVQLYIGTECNNPRP